jgi:hypothetical protein
MDLGPAYAKAVRKRAPDAVICFDPFHVVKLAGDALDSVRRQVWQSARRYPDKSIAAKFKGARWALLKNPQDLTEDQADTLKALRRNGGALWRAYQLKEALRAVFAGDLATGDVMDLIDRWCSRAQRSRIPEFVKTGATIRRNKDGITAAIERGLSNGRHEGLNNKIRTMTRRAYGFHSPQAALALIMLTCGPTTLTLPYHTAPDPQLWQESLTSLPAEPGRQLSALSDVGQRVCVDGGDSGLVASPRRIVPPYARPGHVRSPGVRAASTPSPACRHSTRREL